MATKKELGVLAEIATDIKWIKKTQEEIKEAQLKQNGRVRKNTIAIASLTSFLVGVGVLEWSNVINIF